MFSDLGTPGEGWNAYEQLRDNLVDLLEPEEMATLGTIFTKVTRHLRAKENS